MGKFERRLLVSTTKRDSTKPEALAVELVSKPGADGCLRLGSSLLIVAFSVIESDGCGESGNDAESFSFESFGIEGSGGERIGGAVFVASILRDSERAFEIVDATDHGCWTEAKKTAYVVPGTVLWRARGIAEGEALKAVVGELPPVENAIFLKQGDLLVLTKDLYPGRSATYDGDGRLLTSAIVGCTIPEVFDDVRSGESIWFDDGKIGGVIEKVEEKRIHVRITQARLRGEKLRSDKGINLPETDLHLAAMTAKDLEDLTFTAEHADVVELSFANTARDVELLQEHLAHLSDRQPAVVLKIETRRGFENLPEMLLTAMRSPCCGVMIARGDLAVECGFERLAEVQEEILWICEAAHVPVIWATQVLETLAKEGLPSRAEITDAAMGDRAECGMLNKGPHIVSALRVLDDILGRMQEHQFKKRPMLRELKLAHSLPDELSGSGDRDPTNG